MPAVPMVPAVPAVPAVRRLRVALQDIETDVFRKSVARMFSELFVRELRKLDGIAVTSMDEVRALFAHETNRQLAGCLGESCLAELVDALGADVLVSAQLARVGDRLLLGVRALTLDGQSRLAQRTLAPGDGTEAFAAIGGLVQELFPDLPLRPGERRGVPAEEVLTLYRPPLSPVWVTATTTLAATAGVISVAAFGLGASRFFTAQGIVDQGRPEAPADGATAMAAWREASAGVTAGWWSLGVAGAVGIASGVLVPFTNFRSDDDEP